MSASHARRAIMIGIESVLGTVKCVGTRGSGVYRTSVASLHCLEYEAQSSSRLGVHVGRCVFR